MNGDNEDMRKAVKDTYGRLAVESRSCCDGPKQAEMIKVYSEEDLSEIPGEVLSSNCSCGNPVALARLTSGQVVVDLGSGAGMDVFLASKKVGPEGRAFGIDATPEMVWKARASAKRMGLENVEFRLGEIEHMPLPDATADVIISNCVINLAPDKSRVFREAYRVLKPNGRLAISDRVLVKELPERSRNDPELWGGCVAGAMLEDSYLALLHEAGFTQVVVEERRLYSDEEAMEFAQSMAEEKRARGSIPDVEVLYHAYKCIANERIVAIKPR
jgi:ubiquinone/menaquinone biosynthesis C-methylase UbiE